MSLKAFHFFFIAMAIILTAGFAIWCVRSYLSESSPSILMLGIGSGLACAGLFVYAFRVRRKLKDFGWI